MNNTITDLNNYLVLDTVSALQFHSIGVIIKIFIIIMIIILTKFAIFQIVSINFLNF